VAGAYAAAVKTPDQFRSAYARLEQLVPRRLRDALTWLSEPEARPVRIPLAILSLIGGCLSFLPVLGLELLPLGLMLLAHDVKSLRRPAGGLTMWLLDRYHGAIQFLLLQHARWTAWSTWVVMGEPKPEGVDAPALPDAPPIAVEATTRSLQHR
jgi:hypothetical protein